MQQISESEFFQTIGRMNVHPRVDESSLKCRYHVSHWGMQDGDRRIVGRSESDSYGVEATKYYSAQ